MGGDSSMVGSRNPQSIVTFHAMVANHDILQGIVEAMPHVKHTGNIWRWNHHGKGLTFCPTAFTTATAALMDGGISVALWLEVPTFLPLGVNSILKIHRIISLFQFNTLHVLRSTKNILAGTISARKTPFQYSEFRGFRK